MRTQKPACLAMRARSGAGLARGQIADIEVRSVQIACMITASLRATATSLAVGGAFGDLLALALDRVPAIEARHQTRHRFAERAPHIGIASLRDATLNVDRGARLSAP